MAKFKITRKLTWLVEEPSLEAAKAQARAVYPPDSGVYFDDGGSFEAHTDFEEIVDEAQ